MAIDYTFIILLGILPNEISFGINSFIRGEGNPHRAMNTIFIGACSNIFLDFIFIKIFGLGIKGAAYATVLSMSISALYVLSYYFSKKSLLRFHIKNFVFKKKLVKSVLIIGSPPCFMHIVSSFIQALMNNRLSEYGGDLAIAVMGVVWTILMILLMPVIGICMGAQPILGYNYGAGNFDRVKRTFVLTLKTSIIICFFGWIVLQFFPEYILILFNDTELFLEMGIEAMQTVVLFIPLVGIPIVTSQYYQALGKPVFSLFLSLMRQTLVLIPFIYILPKYYGLRGIWWAVPASDICVFSLALIFIIFEFRKMRIKSRIVKNHF
jgi:putative MATE family efflux protein